MTMLHKEGQSAIRKMPFEPAVLTVVTFDARDVVSSSLTVDLPFVPFLGEEFETDFS